MKIGHFPEELETKTLRKYRQGQREHRQLQVLRDFPFVRPSGEVLIVPAGYITDGTSNPRPLWRIEPPWGEVVEAAVHHDWRYSLGDRSRAEADRIFLEGMEALGTAWWKRAMLYAGVRAGGEGGFKLPAEHAHAAGVLTTWTAKRALIDPT